MLPSDSERLWFPFKIAYSGLKKYNKKSGFKCMFVVCIAYYIWAWPLSPTSNYVLSTDGKRLHGHTHTRSHSAGICNCVKVLWILEGIWIMGSRVLLKECPGASETRERSSRQAVVELNEERRLHLWHKWIPFSSISSCVVVHIICILKNTDVYVNMYEKKKKSQKRWTEKRVVTFHTFQLI